MDFYRIIEKHSKNDVIEIYPDFKACRSKDLMIRGKSFYAVWDEDKNIWSTDEYDIQRLVDQELEQYKKKIEKKRSGNIEIKRMINFSSNMWKNYRSFIREMSDNAHQLDENLTFTNSNVKKSDYVSRKLSYALEESPIAAYDEMMKTLYEPEERQKLEWAIGSIIAGDSKNIQKFIVLYGETGTGKSTFLNILQKLFEGYYTTFEAKTLTSASNSFSTEMFKTNPLVAIQHDGDLSRIEDNTKLNSIISHEEMTMNEKYKPAYMARSNAFLFMGTNKPVKITDAKSGIIRRLIDVRPSGNKLPNKRYHILMSQIDFELGGIAWYCLQVYKKLGKNYYSNYRPLDMMYQTDVFFNFVESNYHFLKEQDGISLSQAYDMYKIYCDEALIDFKFPRHKFREELKSYFCSFSDIKRVDGKQIRSYYNGFIIDKFTINEKKEEEQPLSLVLDNTSSLIDTLFSDCLAQYANQYNTPEKKWAEVTTKLSEINTKELHYVKLPKNYIVIDFDLKDEMGLKSMELNLEAASKWPPTYSEFSKSGSGVHLHYYYEGDISKISRVYSEDIEIKTFIGQSSLRRKLSKCNTLPITKIKTGLPLKGDKMINLDAIQSETKIRDLILRNLKKEIHPSTKPSIDFIWKILDDAYKSGIKYDVTDLKQKILVFANNSTNQSDYCIKLISKMRFMSDEPNKPVENYQSNEFIFFDVEVFPNLFIVVWKKENGEPVKMINPSANEIKDLMSFKLIGFNNRRYDNHILYARYLGYDNFQLFQLSQKIINGSHNCLFGEAYNISYTDVYDFSSKKQSLKKFQIELKINHQELGFKWDEEVAEYLWDKVADYCVNDVISLQKVFEARAQDFVARLILSDLSGLTPNDTTKTHTAKIIFGDDKNPSDKFVYTDLSEDFPGYTFNNGKSLYKNEDPGEGGYVYAEPGMYSNVTVLDVASMHPTSLVCLNMFGPYTKNFKELLDARLAIKHKQYDKVKNMLGGILTKYLVNETDSTALSYALKIIINIVYGLTSAKFDNKFKDLRNKDNIVAKRGALFMIDLKNEVQQKGFKVIHIKTDSIKIPNASQEIITFVMEFGKKYGYTFEQEDFYERFCLVNNAVYIAKNKKGEWITVGEQFTKPYVFKTLFSKEEIVFTDLIETKNVSTSLYLDMNENMKEEEHNYHFVGKTGAFCPIKSGCGGGLLLREKNGKYYAADGTKGFRWLESDMVKTLNREVDIDLNYYHILVNAAVEDISKFGDFEWFTSIEYIKDNKEELIGFNDTPPWCSPCGKEACIGCSNHHINSETGCECKLGY